MPSTEINSPSGQPDSALALRQARDCGFSLLELLVSVLIIVVLMSAVFPFIMQSQKRFQGNQVTSESNQSGRAALEVMAQEIGQAGFNPSFNPNKNSSASVAPAPLPQCVTLDGITGISPGDWVSVDKGDNNELVQVTSTSNPPTLSGACAGANQIQGIFQSCHNHNTLPECPATTPMGAFPVVSYKMPFGGGLLIHYTAGVADTTESNDQRLEFYGDINQDGTIKYVVYSISPMVPAVTVCIPQVAAGVGCAPANTYKLYNLYRSITNVPFTSLPPAPACTVTASPYTTCSAANNLASPMVEKVLYNTTNAAGPTGKAIFNYPLQNQIPVGVIPNQVTVVGTIVITICVAANPKSMETGVVSWYTMATQIRPLNLSASVNINNSGGAKYLSLIPPSLPMTFPAGYAP